MAETYLDNLTASPQVLLRLDEDLEASQVLARLLVSRERSDGEERSEVPGGGGGQVLSHLRVGDVTYKQVCRWPKRTWLILTLSSRCW